MCFCSLVVWGVRRFFFVDIGLYCKFSFDLNFIWMLYGVLFFGFLCDLRVVNFIKSEVFIDEFNKIFGKFDLLFGFNSIEVSMGIRGNYCGGFNF